MPASLAVLAWLPIVTYGAAPGERNDVSLTAAPGTTRSATAPGVRST